MKSKKSLNSPFSLSSKIALLAAYPTPLITLRGIRIPSSSLLYPILELLTLGFKNLIPLLLASSIYSLVLASPPILIFNKLIKKYSSKYVFKNAIWYEIIAYATACDLLKPKDANL